MAVLSKGFKSLGRKPRMPANQDAGGSFKEINGLTNFLCYAKKVVCSSMNNSPIPSKIL